MLLSRAAVFAVLSCFFCFTASAEDRLLAGEHDAVIDGTRIHYVVAGHGPLLVVQAPGWGIGSSYLQKGLSTLEQRFTVLTYDPRNSGKSVRVANPEKLNTSQMADDLEKLRTYWGLDRMDLLGHSHGGAIALAYAERYPDRVSHLVLVGAQLIGFSGAAESKAIGVRQKADPAFKEAYSGSRSTDNDDQLVADFKLTFDMYLHDPKKSHDAVAATLPDTMVASSQGAETVIPGTPQVNEVADLPKVTARTLLIVGRDDIACPPMVSQRMHQGIAGSKVEIFEESGHFPWAEEPSRFFSSVEGFLLAR